jgi:hypothetical protein
VVEKQLKTQPLIALWLNQGLLNYMAVARYFRPQIERELGVKVSAQTIGMSLRRAIGKMEIPDSFELPMPKISQYGVQLNLVEYTFPKSWALSDKSSDTARYFVKTMGSTESTVIISQEDSHLINTNDVKITKKNIAAITLLLDDQTIAATGVYAHLLLLVALHNIAIVEVVSTLHELAIIVKQEDIDRTLTALKPVQ